MASKTHLNKLIQLSNNEEAALANLNANVDILNDVIDDYVSRSGLVPTQLQEPLDLGNQRIINVGTPESDNDVVRYKDVKDALDELHSIEADLQDVENAVIRANNAASSADQSAGVATAAKVDAIDAKNDAVSAKNAAVQAKDDITTLLTVDYPEITTVANNISDVQTVAGVASDVSTVAGIASDVADVADIVSDVSTVANVDSDVSTVAGIASDVSAVAGVSTAVQAVEDNLTAVQNAAQNASDAANSAELAHKWATSSTVVESGQYGASYYALRAANYMNGAESARDLARNWANKTDGTVADSEYSAKYYAEQAAAIVAVLGTVMTYKGSVASYADLPSSGNTTGDVWNVLDTGKNYAWTGSAWDDFGGAITVSLASCSDVSLTTPATGDTLVYNATTQKWENGRGLSSLTDIAIAGDGVTFTTPSNIDYVSSSDKVNSATISSTGIFAPTGSQYIQFTSSSIPNYTGSIFTGNYDWSWTFKFKSAADVSQMQVIFKAGYSLSNFNIWCAVSEGNSTPKHIALGIHLSNNTWSNATSGDGITEIQPNTWYWVRLSRDYTNGVYKLELSTDGTNWITDLSFNSNLALFNAYATFYLANTYSSAGDGVSEYDMTGCKFTTSYSSVNDYVAYVADGRTTISSPLPSSVVQNTATGQHAFSIGEAVSSGNCNVAIGWRAYASNESIAIGNRSTNSSSSDYAKATGGYSIAIGFCTEATGSKSVAIGGNSVKATQDGSTAIGGDAESTATGATALGYIAKATANYAIQLGRGTNSTANTLSVGLSVNDNYTLLNSDGTIPVARYIAFTGTDGVNAGAAGTVPPPTTSDAGKFLCADGTWAAAGGGSASYDALTETITL